MFSGFWLWTGRLWFLWRFWTWDESVIWPQMLSVSWKSNHMTMFFVPPAVSSDLNIFCLLSSVPFVLETITWLNMLTQLMEPQEGTDVFCPDVTILMPQIKPDMKLMFLLAADWPSGSTNKVICMTFSSPTAEMVLLIDGWKMADNMGTRGLLLFENSHVHTFFSPSRVNHVEPKKSTWPWRSWRTLAALHCC